MDKMLQDIGIFAIAILIHEIGHYISYLTFKVKPDIKVKWYGAIIIGENVYPYLTPLKAYFVNISGVLWGAVVLAYFTVSKEYWLIYILMSGIDILNMIQLLEIKKEWKNKPLIEIVELQLKEIVESKK